MMHRNVRAGCHQFQIPRLIIQCIFVPMVHDLPGPQWTA